MYLHNTCIHTFIHSYIHTCIHTYIPMLNHCFRNMQQLWLCTVTNYCIIALHNKTNTLLIGTYTFAGWSLIGNNLSKFISTKVSLTPNPYQ